LEFVATMTGQSLPNILKLFSTKKVNGALEISDQDFKSTIWIKEGQVIHASSNKALSLIDSLKVLNIIDFDKYTQLSESNISDDKMDKLLIDSGLVQDKILTYLRTHQAAETLYSIVELEKANYELKKDKVLDLGREDLIHNSYNWIAEVYQNMYSWVQIRTKVSKNIIKIRAKDIKNIDLTKEEEKIYRLCIGGKDIRDVILWSSTTYFKAYSLIATLVSKGYLEFEEQSVAMNEKLISEIVKILDSMEQMPGIKTAFVVDKEGKMIAKDSRRSHDENQASSETMAAIFSHTVSDFETNMKDEEDHSANQGIEQLLVERNNGDKTLLFVTGRFILVTEAFKDCDWGLLRLSAKRSMSSIRQLVSIPG
jgi:predicted regulator of Ras-like GTPase activity (Roadblock/LC7/MglB family)